MHRTAIIALALTLVATVYAAPPPDAPADNPALPTVAELAKRGLETLELIESGKARLSCRTEVGIKGATFELVDIIASDKRKRVARWMQGGSSTDVFSIVERGDVWHVRQFSQPPGRYRPHEAPLAFPNAGLVLALGRPHALESDTVGKVTAVHGDVAEVHGPLPAAAKAQVQSAIAMVRGLLRTFDEGPEAERARQEITRLKEILEKGVSVEVDVGTGVVLRSREGQFEHKVTSLSTKTVDAPEAFDVSDVQWKDVTNDPTLAANLGDLIMIQNSPLATPALLARSPAALETCEAALDGMLVNLSTGQMRRIPIPYGQSMPGCFSKDRKRVYVSANEWGDSGLFVYEVDLSTGRSRRVGEGSLPQGMATGPALSPDGTTLALSVLSADMTASQICLVDLKTDAIRKLGAPLDTAYLSWLDDGQGLVLVARKHTGKDRFRNESVARMDMNGKVTVLAPGSNPIVIPGRNRILHCEQGQWRTCDLDGKDVETYCGGMRGYHHPTVSPDGKRILWMFHEKGPLSPPVTQDFGEKEVRELDLGPSLWAYPAWK